MRVLLIEDEEHKVADLTIRLSNAGVSGDDLHVSSGVRDAVLRSTSEPFDLIVLDMALPTFAKGLAGGTEQSVGGVEILRGLKDSGLRRQIIVVTQYPGIVIGGKHVRLSQIPKVVSERYHQDVLGAVLYRFKTPEWETEFDGLLARAK